MTALRQSAIMELEKIPEDKLSFVIQIMQGVNGLYNDTNKERKEAFARLEQLRKKGTVTDDDAEQIKVGIKLSKVQELVVKNSKMNLTKATATPSATADTSSSSK